MNLPIRSNARRELLIFGLALALYVGVALGVAHSVGIRLAALGAYLDGHLYLEIARSFPLPFAAESLDYAGQAPAYPGLAWLLRVLLLPDAFVNWGLAMLLASWIPAALAAVAFYRLCSELRLPGLWPSLLFAAANPRWVAIASLPHAEPLAMLFAILALRAYFRDRLGWCVAFLTAATLTRYSALLLCAPLAVDVLLVRRRTSIRNLLLLAVPALAVAAMHLYLRSRVDDFTTIWQAHRVFWNVTLTAPFASMLRFGTQLDLPWDHLLAEITYASLLLYLLSIVVGFRPSQRQRWLLPGCVAVLVLFHVSLSGRIGVGAFTRLVVLAWPAALLVLWSWLGARVHGLAAAGLCIASAVFGIHYVLGFAPAGVRFQQENHLFLRATVERLDEDEPRWTNFRELREARQPGPPG